KSGKTDGLDEKQRATLEKWMAEKPIGDGELQTLARTRAERLRDTLAREHGIEGTRVTLGDAQVDREKGKAGVGVAIAGG
ncbi:MAG TPA: hypothetical protein VKA21_11925, partial [Candidatus Binatia bacterium]|nr:hypothetical protein [Candidatus Binatia bacterium]